MKKVPNPRKKKYHPRYYQETSKAYYQKHKEKLKANYRKLTPEEKARYNQQQVEWKEINPDKVKAQREKDNKKSREKYANMTPEEKKEYIKKRVEGHKKRVSKETPKQTAMRRAKNNEYNHKNRGRTKKRKARKR